MLSTLFHPYKIKRFILIALKFTLSTSIKSIIHCPNEYQDVSTEARFDEFSNRFYLRDIRSEGKVISNIEYNNLSYPIGFKYDSCPKEFGKPDMYYIPFSKYENDEM